MDEEYEESEALDIKESLLYKIEYLDLTTLMYYINNLYFSKFQIEEYKKQNKRVIINRKTYKGIYGEIDLIECDKDVQSAIWCKLQDLDYDEDSMESRAVAVHTMGTALWLSDVFEKMEENSSYSIEDFLTDNLEDFNTEDLLQIVEWVDLDKLMFFPKIRNVIADRISEMSDGELTIFFANLNISYKNDERIKRELEERILKCEKYYLPFYIRFLSFDDKMIAKFLANVEKKSQVNAIISANVSAKHNKQVTTQLEQMIKNLSDDEFVRYMCSATIENDDLKPIVIERLKKLSDADIAFLTPVYFEYTAPTYKHNVLANLAVSRDLIEENEHGVKYCGYDENQVLPKYKIYCASNRYFDALPYFSGFDLAELDKNQSSISKQKMVEAFTRNNRIMRNYYKFMDFIGTLAKSKDEDIYKIILDVNKDYKFPPDMERDFKVYFNFTELYLINRILNMENKKLLSRLHILGNYDLPLSVAVMVRMSEKEIPQPNSLENISNNFWDFKKHNDNEKELDSKDLDDSDERE